MASENKLQEVVHSTLAQIRNMIDADTVIGTPVETAAGVVSAPCYGYVDNDGSPRYPFGYGLSYTRFKFGNLSLSAETIAPGESITATFTVTNTGDREGAAVPQLYIRDEFASVVKPRRALAAFEKVTLKPGETKTVSATISPRAMRTLGRDFKWRVEPGDFSVWLAEDAEHPIMKRAFRVE